jgi:hypothetical protein
MPAYCVVSSSIKISSKTSQKAFQRPFKAAVQIAFEELQQLVHPQTN